jgi:DNA-binding Xre family transcriptional regulator
MIFSSEILHNKMRESVKKDLTMRKTRIRMKELAEDRQIKMAQLARKADVDYRTILRIARDPYQSVQLKILMKLATALGVRLDEMVEFLDP